MVKESKHLDGQYAAFGQLTEGFEAADKIVGAPTDFKNRPEEDQIMKKVTIEIIE
jgi:peptidyl-prolyl cis-trans isomerase B (cyclophilin B)